MQAFIHVGSVPGIARGYGEEDQAIHYWWLTLIVIYCCFAFCLALRAVSSGCVYGSYCSVTRRKEENCWVTALRSGGLIRLFNDQSIQTYFNMMHDDN